MDAQHDRHLAVNGDCVDLRLEDLVDGSVHHGPRLDGVVIGSLVEIDPDGRAKVDFPGNPAGAPIYALTTVTVTARDRGREVALMFVQGDVCQPLLVGMLQNAAQARALHATVDGSRVVLDAAEEIVLRCGEASITLTRAGKVLIRGAYVLSRSSGVNRIKGGSVQIN